MQYKSFDKTVTREYSDENIIHELKVKFTNIKYNIDNIKTNSTSSYFSKKQT